MYKSLEQKYGEHGIDVVSSDVQLTTSALATFASTQIAHDNAIITESDDKNYNSEEFRQHGSRSDFDDSSDSSDESDYQ